MSDPRSIDPNDHDRFILRQRFRLMTNEYVFSLPGADGETPDRDFCFVRQRTFKLKEDIGFYTDENRSQELMRIKARQRFDPRARYDVTAADGSKIGEIQKVFGASLLRSTYRLYDATGTEVAVATERNAVVAILRRLTGFLGFIPIAGVVVDFLPIPYHFVFLKDGVELGSHRRHLWKIRDTYTIDLSGHPNAPSIAG